ncbi:MAG TPA: DegT/DnrJ/EryC1/StrS family aminotransferase, partial [Candidatus Limnocylindrales bacterium]|nr:DegT/DnrJ/EryC1/StrS family aminotransferase [Candidatus Limnocylindrales bacterium]
NGALAGLTGLIERLPGEPDHARSVYFGYHILFRTAALRDRAEADLHAAGVETRPFFSVIPDETPYRALGFLPEDTPVAADVASRGLYVSNAPTLLAADRTLIIDTLHALARAEGLSA